MNISNSTKVARVSLQAAAEAIAELDQLLPTMKLKDQIDACAVLVKAKNIIEKLDKAVKSGIKKELKNKDGTTDGFKYRANLAYNPVTRLNSTKLKEEDLTTWNKYAETNDEGRITFEKI